MSSDASFYDRAFDTDAVIERIKDHLRVKNDKELAKKLDISQSTLSSWRKRASIPLPYVIAICRTYHVSMDYLFFGKEISISISASEMDENVMKISFMASLNEIGLDLSTQLSVTERALVFYKIMRSAATAMKSISGMSAEKSHEILDKMLEELTRKDQTD